MKNPQRILITGCNGSLGVPLERRLTAHGHDVFGVDLQHDRYPNHMRADVSKYRQLERAFIEFSPTVVYHLAAEFGRRNGDEYYETMWASNCIGTRNILELCEKYGARLFFASSSEAYGEVVPRDSQGDVLPLVESATKITPRFTNEYAISKFTNELQIDTFMRKHGLDATVFRFFNVYGPEEAYTPYRSVVSLFCHQALHGIDLVVHADSYRCFTYIDDFIDTLAYAVDAPSLAEPTYNIGGDDYRSVEELAEIVMDCVPSSNSEVHILAPEMNNVICKKAGIELARRDLGHDPVTKLEDGVRMTVEWMKKNI